MLPALSQFKINHVGAKSSPNPIPMLPTLCHTHRPLLLRSSSSSDIRNVSGLKITAHVETDFTTHLERCLNAPVASEPLSMKGGQYGSLGAVTLEKSKLDLSQKETVSSPEGEKTAQRQGEALLMDQKSSDAMEGSSGCGGFCNRLFDRKFVDAVLNEWQRTMMDLPAGLRQAYEMGLVSSAQMVKFLAINARPTTSRFISRTLPQTLSRSFIGRLLADPAFLYRLVLEEVATVGCSLWWEIKNRKHRIKQEWDLALMNVLTAAACNALVVWSLAPCRSYGNTFRFDLQNTLQKLPNNIFEKSYPLREFDLQKRIQCFLFKAAELCMVGLSAGAVQGAVSNTLASKKEGRLSVTVPSVSSNALGYGAFLGIYANLRYQLLGGFDRAMMTHFDVIGVALFFSTTFRVLNVQLGETSKRAWLGVEADPLAQSDDLLKVYNRTSENVETPSSKWFISKNAVVSGLGLLGIKQRNADGAGAESSAPKARRKRVVRKKVAAGSA
ncbi:hypothetical protein ACSQ67_013311 [Phaseolus vulgaris]